MSDYKEYREWAKKRGICIQCFRERAWNGRLMCAECLAKAQEGSERTRTTISKEQRKRYLKRKREICIAFGICRECLKRKATVGLKCTECHVKQINRNAKKRKDVIRSMRVELGLCYFCGEKVLPGKRTCKKHYEMTSSNIKKWDRDNKNHHWRSVIKGEVERVRYYHEKYKKGITNAYTR